MPCAHPTLTLQAARATAVAAHQATVAAVTAELEARLGVARDRREKAEADAAAAEAEWEEAQRQMEEDLDGELEVRACRAWEVP